MGENYCFECIWWQLTEGRVEVHDCKGKCTAPLPLPLELEREGLNLSISAGCRGCQCWKDRNLRGSL